MGIGNSECDIVGTREAIIWVVADRLPAVGCSSIRTRGYIAD